jgi:hypothetical protein
VSMGERYRGSGADSGLPSSRAIDDEPWLRAVGGNVVVLRR